jgi:hypothetical protein
MRCEHLAEESVIKYIRCNLKLEEIGMKDFVRIDIDELANRCGYFTSETCVNSGYGCNHPDQEMTRELKDEDGRMHVQGCCYSFSCPLGWSDDELEKCVCMSKSEAINIGLTEYNFLEM